MSQTIKEFNKRLAYQVVRASVEKIIDTCIVQHVHSASGTTVRFRVTVPETEVEVDVSLMDAF